MDAELVWRVWRRILREPELSACLTEGEHGELALRFGLSPEELEIAAAYAATAQRTRWFVVNYRYRLVSSICFALEHCAPLTWRLLHVRRFDVRELSSQFLDAEGWIDDGPYVYRAAARMLDHVRKTLADRIEGLEDIVALDSLSVELVRSLADASPSEWPSPEQRACWAADPGNWRFQRTRLGRVVGTRLQLTPWLRESAAFGTQALTSGEEIFLAYLPSLQVRPKLARIPVEGSAMLDDLRNPCTFAELCPTPGRRAPAAILERFLRYGVVRGIELV